MNLPARMREAADTLEEVSGLVRLPGGLVRPVVG